MSGVVGGQIEGGRGGEGGGETVPYPVGAAPQPARCDVGVRCASFPRELPSSSYDDVINAKPKAFNRREYGVITFRMELRYRYI